MFCPRCGKENPAGTKFCGACGNAIGLAAGGHINSTIGGEPMTFGKAIAICLSKYADFEGRAARPEYWWFYLFTVLVSWCVLLVDPSGILYGLVSIGLMLPSLAAGARRLHDTNRSGWWQLIAFTIIGLIPLILWLATQGDTNENRFGGPV